MPIITVADNGEPPSWLILYNVEKNSKWRRQSLAVSGLDIFLDE